MCVYFPSLASQLLPVMTEQLQWMPFVGAKLHEPFVKFIYWSLRQLDAGAQVSGELWSPANEILFHPLSHDLVLSVFFHVLCFMFQDLSLLPILLFTTFSFSVFYFSVQ